jgi:hypothetical protein
VLAGTLTAIAAALVVAGCTSASSPRSATATMPAPARTTTTNPARAAGWSTPEPVAAGGLEQVSCAPEVADCSAVTGTEAFTSTGSRWSGPLPLPGFGGPPPASGPAAVVSCPAPGFCLAVSADGTSARFDGTSWHRAGTLTAAHQPGAVSCASPTFCMAVDAEGFSYRYDGAGWAQTAGAWGSASSLSCASPTLCMAADGGVAQWNGSAWSKPDSIDQNGQVVAVSCPSSTFCMAVDDTGTALRFDGSAWKSPGPLPGARVPGTGASVGEPAALSCAGPTFCVAVGSHGLAWRYDGTAWSAPVDVDAGHALTSVSCPAPGTCVAVDARGWAVRLGPPA